MHQPLELPSRTGHIRTVDRDLFFVTLDLRAAYGTLRRHAHLFRGIVSIAALRNGTDDLRYHLTSALDLHPIARSQILLADEIEIVQRRQLHGRATDLHWLEHRERIQCPGS